MEREISRKNQPDHDDDEEPMAAKAIAHSPTEVNVTDRQAKNIGKPKADFAKNDQQRRDSGSTGRSKEIPANVRKRCEEDGPCVIRKRS